MEGKACLGYAERSLAPSEHAAPLQGPAASVRVAGGSGVLHHAYSIGAGS